MYKKVFSATLLSVFLLTFAFSVAFAQVTVPKEGCDVSAGQKAGGWKTVKVKINTVTADPSAQEVVWLEKSGVMLVSSKLGALTAATFNTKKYVAKNTIPSTLTDLTEAIARGFIIAGPDGFFMPQTAVSAQSNIGIKSGNNVPPNWAVFCLLNTIDNVVNWIFIFLIAVSVALIAMAGFMWMTAGASPEKQKLAGKMLMGAVIGIVIAILARVIPALITGILS